MFPFKHLLISFSYIIIFNTKLKRCYSILVKNTNLILISAIVSSDKRSKQKANIMSLRFTTTSPNYLTQLRKSTEQCKKSSQYVRNYQQTSDKLWSFYF